MRWMRTWIIHNRCLLGGGNTQHSARTVAADNSGNVYIAGHTASDLAGPYRGALDAWVAKFDAGGHLQWKRQLGTVLDDAARGVTSNANGNVIAGQRCSSV